MVTLRKPFVRPVHGSLTGFVPTVMLFVLSHQGYLKMWKLENYYQVSHNHKRRILDWKFAILSTTIYIFGFVHILLFFLGGGDKTDILM